MGGDLAIKIVILTFVVIAVHCHPQCLDFLPPFEAETPLTFCSNYSDFGCCTEQDDRNLLETFRTIQESLSASEWNRCQGYAKELLCQNCSPYAAHVYDAERTMQAKTFPGLCTDYCMEFVERCRNIIPYVDPSMIGSSLLIHGYVFCQHVSLTDVDYCYPDLLTSCFTMKPGM